MYLFICVDNLIKLLIITYRTRDTLFWSSNENRYTRDSNPDHRQTERLGSRGKVIRFQSAYKFVKIHQTGPMLALMTQCSRSTFFKNWPVSSKATFFSWGKRSSLTAMELSPRTLSGEGFEIKRRRKIIGSNYFEKLLQRKSRKAKNQGKNIWWKCWSFFKLNSLHNNYVAS